MPRWTDDQLKAIETRDKNILVSAAAGSGKTAVLVERIIRLILDEENPVDITEFLIITFTNAAASEMRERITEALTEALLENPSSTHLRKQLTLMNHAQISTIHSFCLSVLREHFHVIDIDPNFQIVDQNRLEIISKESLEELLESAYEEAYSKDDQAFLSFMDGYSNNKNDYWIRDMILKISSFVMSQPEPDEWFKRTLDLYNTMDQEDHLWVNLLRDQSLTKMKGLLDVLNGALELSEAAGGPFKYIDTIKEDLSNLNHYINIANRDFNEFSESIVHISYGKLASVRKTDDVDPDMKKKAQEARNSYKDEMNSIKDLFLEKSLSRHIEEGQILGSYLEILLGLVQGYLEFFKMNKLDMNYVDFSDIEHYTIDCLKFEDVSSVYRERFKYIFLDEYQDSNRVQEAIVSFIKRENNVFLVGDVKQSIYKFRLADPTMFLEKYKVFSGSDSGDVKIDLSMNFRSRDTILHGINHLFKSLMTESFGEIDYSEAVYLYPGMTFNAVDAPEVDVRLIDMTKNENLDELMKDLVKEEVEAYHVAKSIKDMIGKPTYNRKKDIYEEISYKDIVILSRSPKAMSPIYEDVFNKVGIPFFSDQSTGYFDTLEIKVFVELLRVIDNKYQDVSMLSVMRSMVGGFSLDEIVSLSDRPNEVTYVEGLMEKRADNLKVDLFLRKLEKWHKDQKVTALDSFIWSLLYETGYYYYVGALPGGKFRQSNLKLLIDRATSFKELTLSDFIQMIEKMEQASVDYGTASVIGENDDVVRMMSIHKSKGLEFPVVFLVGASKKFNLRDSYGNMVLHKELGIGLKYINPDLRTRSKSLSTMVMAEAIKEEALSEEMRVLYVAMTRAVDRLIITGTIANMETAFKKYSRGMTTYNLRAGSSYMDWIMSILYRDHWDLSETSVYNYGNVDFRIGSITGEAILDTRDDELILEEVENEVSSLELDFSDLFIGHVKKGDYTPQKYTVTELSKGALDASLDIPALVELPNFLESEEKITGIRKGQVVHKALQFMDFKACSSLDAIKLQLQGMVDSNILLAEEAKAISPSWIMKFVSSDLGKRLVTSVNVEREMPFIHRTMIDGEEILLQGMIDLYFEESDGVIILDYKTDYVNDDNIEDLITQYSRQITYYGDAVEAIMNKTVKEKYIYFIGAQRFVLVE